jgi:methionyl-tRNA formyltransferase
VQALQLAASGGLRPVAQPADGVTYAHKIEKSEARIDWSQPAGVLERRIRAFDPFPGATTEFEGETVKAWAARVLPGGSTPAGPPGTVLEVSARGIAVACGDGCLLLTELQRPGGRRLPVADFLRGCPLAPGARLGTTPGAPAPAG